MSTFLLYLGIAVALIVLFNVLLVAVLLMRDRDNDRANDHSY